MSLEIYPKVSIVIPFYKNSTYLQECVKHCLSLDYPKYEVIVVSNSPVEFADRRIKVIVTDEIGQACKKDVGVTHASGEICAFVDDDAYPSKDWIKNAVKYFDEYDVVAVGGPGVTPPDDDLMQQAGGLVYSQPIASGNFRHRYIGDEAETADDLQGYNLFVRKSFLEEIGGINVKYRSGEDNILSRRIISYGKKFRFASDVVVYHHRRRLFVPHLKQISTYALHRGYFTKKYPEFFAKFPCMIPSILLLGLIAWTLLSILITVLRLPLIISIAGYFTVSFVWLLLTCRSVKLSALASMGITLSHITYAVFFVYGLLLADVGERPSY